MSTNASSMEEVLAALKDPALRRTETARILLRHDLRTRHQELEETLVEALRGDMVLNRDPEAPKIARQIEEIEAEIEAAQIVFRFAQIGHGSWAELMRAHPPTPQQLAAARRAKETPPDHNEDTFWPAALAASCTSPAMTEEQAAELIAGLPVSAVAELRTKCFLANVGGDGVPKSVAAGVILRRSDASGTTPASEESLDQSSSGDE